MLSGGADVAAVAAESFQACENVLEDPTRGKVCMAAHPRLGQESLLVIPERSPPAGD